MTTAPSSRPEPPSLGRLVELAVTVPLEVGVRVVEAVPAVVDKLPGAAERVRQEIVLARFIGRLAVDQGIREIRARLTPGDEPAGGTDETAPPPPEPPADTADRPDAPDVDTLALADYDHLSSAQIVAKLDGLDADELAAIGDYERANRHRRTILGKLEQLGEAGT
jgi:hypothetical protein